jgi:hypothetical protein
VGGDDPYHRAAEVVPLQNLQNFAPVYQF